MKKLNCVGEVLLKDSTESKCKIIVELAKEMGVPVYYKTAEKPYNEDFPIIGWSREHITQFGQIYSSDYKTVSFDEFVKLILEATPVLKMELTSDYTAEVSDDGIKVGCQLITFDKFDELSKLVAEKRK